MAPKYPCGLCCKPCKTNQTAIFCDICCNWIHLKCTTLTPNQFTALGNSDDVYYCIMCLNSVLPLSLNNRELSLALSESRDCAQSIDHLITDKKSFANVDDCNHVDLASTYSPFLNCPSLSLVLAHVNIRSLQRNIDNLHEFLCTLGTPVSVLGISETKLQTDPVVNINITGFTFIHSPTKSKAGGVGLYIRDNLAFQPVCKYTLADCDCEQLWVEVSDLPTNMGSFVIGVIYRHPRGNIHRFVEEFCAGLDRLMDDNKRFMILETSILTFFLILLSQEIT